MGFDSEVLGFAFVLQICARGLIKLITAYSHFNEVIIHVKPSKFLTKQAINMKEEAVQASYIKELTWQLFLDGKGIWF